jgi:penicillin-binding protein 2
MYKQRLNICIFLVLAAAGVCLSRLAWLQIVWRDASRAQMVHTEVYRPISLPTVRGSIQDRAGRTLAYDSPAFYLHVNYRLSRLLDDRFWETIIRSQLRDDKTRDEVELALHNEYAKDKAALEQILNLCATIRGCDADDIREILRSSNETIWRLRRHLAWRKKFPDAPNIPDAEKDKALSPFDILRIDIVEMHKAYPVIELKTEQERYQVQVETAGMADVEILPEPKRIYPFGSTGCQIVGWVGPAQPQENALFPEDEYAQYLPNEVSGKDGVERICEVMLRGRRGEVTYDKEGDILDRKNTLLGKDVRLTLDIRLQQKIEQLLSDPNDASGAAPGMGVVVMDVAGGDILAMVSRPTFDLNLVREDYVRYLKNPRKPMTNRCLAEHYPPGSSIKPVILLAGLEEHKITATEVISCPFQTAETGWPNCLLFRQYHSCHDWKWPNFARNAIRGSCNVYFSRLAGRLEVPALQRWLWEFGFGRRILPGPEMEPYGPDRFFPESPGMISLEPVYDRSATVQDIPTMPAAEKRWFGIGQGNLRVTVLQVANAYAAIARGGVFKSPRLFASDEAPTGDAEHPLKIAKSSLAVLLDGMHAVVYEEGGTANKVFAGSDFGKRSMTIYGKTGSTERPYHAWFACFATDSSGRALSVAILVEGGASGARDACPIGRRVLEVCNEFDYIGTPLR